MCVCVRMDDLGIEQFTLMKVLDRKATHDLGRLLRFVSFVTKGKTKQVEKKKKSVSSWVKR